jgi:hypothetical protein
MRFLYSFIFVVFTTSICFSETGKKESNPFIFHSAGLGAVTCYEFLHPGQMDFIGRDFTVLAWVQGYMTAKNYYSDYDVALLTLNVDEQIVIIKIYCEEHKRDKVRNAAEYLYGELYKKGKQEK